MALGSVDASVETQLQRLSLTPESRRPDVAELRLCVRGTTAITRKTQKILASVVQCKIRK